MRVKEIDRTANVAWSPENKFPIYIATGTAAQQLDATFSTSSSIELYSLNLDEATLDMPQVASVTSNFRFHKIVWGQMKDTESGYLIGGSENGSIYIYSADKMLAKSADCLVAELTRHVGAVKALDLNPFQPNLLASGAGDSEIYIWDLLKTENPMTPGQKSQPPEELACVAWNQQVQHILGSTFGSRSVVWDLRKNEPIIKISDSMSRIKAKLLAWHPEVATQLCLSSEDDHTPVIQVWDLRYATSPLKVLESHRNLSLSFVASAFRFTLTIHSVKMSKRKHSAYTIDFKLQILSEAEEKKLTKTEICKKHSIPNSTLSTILKDTEKLQKARDDSKF
ncbi:transport protein Sec31A [Elysia marginata]|uniref:Transport protein Sec31A n=1 Tax=Elysia marginata TaxID=1093978 RepID=A0AAV4FY20_9GAST|nr:transport protein Sec31A [Elysia marginata]